MSTYINKCTICHTFTLQTTHCDKKTTKTQPAKFQPDDKYAHLKRKAKHDERKEAGLI